MFDKTNLRPLEKHVHLAIATPHPEIGKVDYSKSGTITTEEYMIISDQRNDVKKVDQETISFDKEECGIVKPVYF